MGLRARQHLKVIGARNEMMMDDYDGQMIFGDLVGLTFVLQVRKNPEKTSPRKPVPIGNRTRARCLTSAHATTCSTAVDARSEIVAVRRRMNMVSNDYNGLSFPDICLTIAEKTSTRKLTQSGIEPGPAACKGDNRIIVKPCARTFIYLFILESRWDDKMS